jgi:DNA-binding XRE family transcriptional regulator
MNMEGKANQFMKSFFLTEKDFLVNLRKTRPDLFNNSNPKAVLARNLVLARKRLRLSQKEVSIKAHVPIATYQRLESAKEETNPGLDRIIQVSVALHTTVGDLFNTGRVAKR